MKSNVVYYILLLLDSERTVRIPGLGAFARRVQPAKILTEKRSVNPPVATVDFTASSKNKGKLLARYISYKSGIDPEVAIYHVEEFAEIVRSNLRESGEVSVDYLGVFRESQSEIIFTPNDDTANAGYLGLKSVGLPTKISLAKQEVISSGTAVPPVQATSKARPESSPDNVTKLPMEAMASGPVVSVPDTAQSSAKALPDKQASAVSGKESKKRKRIPILLPIFLTVFLGVTALAIMQFNKRGAIYHPAATYNRAPAEDQPVFGNDRKTETEFAIPSDEGNEATGNDEFLQDIISKNTLDLMRIDENSGEIAEKNDVSQSQDQQPSENSPSKESAVSDETLVIDEEVVSNPNLTHTVPRVTKENDLISDCYVIVGAFGVQSNVERMMARLTEMGYTPASMPRNNLTQIGVPAPCGSTDIQSILLNLQQHVEADAWILNK